MFFKILAAKIIPCQNFPAYHFELAAYCVALQSVRIQVFIGGHIARFLEVKDYIF